jgi:hypothetical protein
MDPLEAEEQQTEPPDEEEEEESYAEKDPTGRFIRVRCVGFSLSRPLPTHYRTLASRSVNALAFSVCELE